MPADKNLIYHPLRNPHHNCPVHRQFEVNLVSCRLAISEIELTYNDTQNVMIIDGHTLPCYFADGFCKPTTKTPFTLKWFSEEFCLILTLQDFDGRMTKIEDRYWIETDSFVHSSLPKKSATNNGIKGTSYPYVHAPHAQNPHNPRLSRFEVLNFLMLKPFVVNLNLSILLSTLIFLLLIPKDLICIQDNRILVL